MVAVLSGLDVLASRLSSLLRGRTVGLLSHQASVTRDLTHARQAIGAIRGVKLLRLFAPEHGLSVAAQDLVSVGAERDALTGLPVVSLYGKRLAPEPRFASFVGLHPLPTRHGMTIGELAGYLNDTHGLGCDLTVVPMLGWQRAMLWEDTGLPWVAPSPNMPTPDTARVYPGGCLVEGTNLSEGRGTTRPFEWVGAPYLDAHRYADALEAERLPGVRFRPARFVPTFHKWAGRLCDGAQVHVTDRARFKPFLTGLALIAVARRQGRRHFAWRRPPYEFERRRLPIDILCGTDAIRRAIERGTSIAMIERSWRRDLTRWLGARRPYLLYS